MFCRPRSPPTSELDFSLRTSDLGHEVKAHEQSVMIVPFLYLPNGYPDGIV